MEEISYACETVPEAEAMRIELGRGVTISIDGDDPDVLVFVDPNLYTGRIDILSPSSPIGEAVLGASLGDVVMAQVGPSVKSVRIINISTDVDLDAGLKWAKHENTSS